MTPKERAQEALLGAAKRIAALVQQDTELRDALQCAFEKAAQEVESLDPYVFVGHVNDYRRNRDDAVKAIRALKAIDWPNSQPNGGDDTGCAPTNKGAA